MKKISKNIVSLGGFLMAGGLMLASCTANFEKYNTNPDEATKEDMTHDNLSEGSYFSQMQRGVFVVGKDMGGEYQITEALQADLYASYFAPTMKWENDNRTDQYVMYMPWVNALFNDSYERIMQPWYEIRKVTTDNSTALAMATVIKVLGMQRVTDAYGPIPYSKFGTDIKIPYDSQEEVYNQMFTELAHAIEVLTDYADKNNSAYLADYDDVYSGNVKKWIKLANTLRLRMAMRISNVAEAKAQAEAAAAIGNKYGLMASADDDALLHQSSTFTFIHPLYEIATSWDDEHMSATMECYLVGYNDPRLGVYFQRATGTGEFKGIRNGKTSISKENYRTNTSRMNYASNSDMEWMRAAEAYFLMAEAKLRWDLGELSAKEYYEKGIRTSFASANVSGADSYIADNQKLPLNKYVDPANSRSTDVSGMLSMRTIAWEDGDDEANLERIMIQKWIALYPNGQEAWSEMRRTGMPGWVRLESYRAQSDVQANEMISRMKFPTTEFTNNTENANEAVKILGGKDGAATRLWWDVKRKN